MFSDPHVLEAKIERYPRCAIFRGSEGVTPVPLRAVAIRETEPAGGRAAVRPPLKWAGGKRWQLPHLEPLWENHRDRRLVEPFCGGLAVTTGLMPRRALLNDINPHVINFYDWLKRGLTISFPMENDGVEYYHSRERFNGLLMAGHAKTSEAAALFYYLNRTGYNGLCRFNARGIFNVPFGTYKTINYKSDFSEYRSAFSNWTFTNVDFEKIPDGMSEAPELKPDPPRVAVPFVLPFPGRASMLWECQGEGRDFLHRNLDEKIGQPPNDSERHKGRPSSPGHDRSSKPLTGLHAIRERPGGYPALSVSADGLRPT